MVCPMMSAWDLHKAWPEADFKVRLGQHPTLAVNCIEGRGCLNQPFG